MRGSRFDERTMPSRYHRMFRFTISSGSVTAEQLSDMAVVALKVWAAEGNWIIFVRSAIYDIRFRYIGLLLINYLLFINFNYFYMQILINKYSITNEEQVESYNLKPTNIHNKWKNEWLNESMNEWSSLPFQFISQSSRSVTKELNCRCSKVWQAYSSGIFMANFPVCF